jgi:hypothetical protein
MGRVKQFSAVATKKTTDSFGIPATEVAPTLVADAAAVFELGTQTSASAMSPAVKSRPESAMSREETTIRSGQ